MPLLSGRTVERDCPCRLGAAHLPSDAPPSGYGTVPPGVRAPLRAPGSLKPGAAPPGEGPAENNRGAALDVQRPSSGAGGYLLLEDREFDPTILLPPGSGPVVGDGLALTGAARDDARSVDVVVDQPQTY